VNSGHHHEKYIIQLRNEREMKKIFQAYKQVAKDKHVPTVQFYSLAIDTLEDYSIFTLDVK